MPVFSTADGVFSLDGKPMTILSGAIHYFRTHPDQWRDRLEKLKDCGFNTVETYTPWNLHEKTPGKFDFTGMLDIGRFLDLAADPQTSGGLLVALPREDAEPLLRKLQTFAPWSAIVGEVSELRATALEFD